MALVSTDHELIDVLDVPLTGYGPRMRPHIDGARLSAIFRAWQPAAAMMEVHEIRSNDTSLAATSRGFALGIVEGVSTAHQVPICRSPTPIWRRLTGLPRSRCVRNAARYAAVATWPMRAEWFQHPAGEIRAEAALIALAGVMQSFGGHVSKEDRR
ncbi:hypothetical protein [Lichenifustis flavocetrariae]|uniref:hypothetical protein n=1 Tax=Lichenifustis flavocetrariae TaxID=2949735 RepID=UPI0024A69495|nr:hypothetical protein [Lichenifustis flavocetrariae]